MGCYTKPSLSLRYKIKSTRKCVGPKEYQKTKNLEQIYNDDLNTEILFCEPYKFPQSKWEVLFEV